MHALGGKVRSDKGVRKVCISSAWTNAVPVVGRITATIHVISKPMCARADQRRRTAQTDPRSCLRKTDRHHRSLRLPRQRPSTGSEGISHSGSFHPISSDFMEQEALPPLAVDYRSTFIQPRKAAAVLPKIAMSMSSSFSTKTLHNISGPGRGAVHPIGSCSSNRTVLQFQCQHERSRPQERRSAGLNRKKSFAVSLSLYGRNRPGTKSVCHH